jgi:hypothetical protein
MRRLVVSVLNKERIHHQMLCLPPALGEMFNKADGLSWKELDPVVHYSEVLFIYCSNEGVFSYKPHSESYSMIRNTTSTVILLLLAGVAIGQVKLKLPDTTAVPGSSLLLPVMAEGFKNVGSFSLTVAFDKNVLTFNGVKNQPSFGFFNATPAASANASGAVGLSWFNVTPSLNIRSGKLLDLQFTYRKGTSPLTFTKMVPSSVTDSLANNLNATVTNGKVSPRQGRTSSRNVNNSARVK